ncbi:Eukaryotic translation initiation factor 3 subunit I [Binucleata daphniae]
MSTQIQIVLHNRPITDLKFNKDGDFLFISSKDSQISLYRLDDNLVGTYNFHDGSINSISIADDTSKLASGAADKMIILWDIEGEPILKNERSSIVRSVYLHNNMLIYCTDDSFSKEPTLGSIDIRSGIVEYEIKLDYVPTKAIIDYKAENIVVGDCDGGITKLEVKQNTNIRKCFHSSKINSVRNSFCGSFFVTGSSDAQVKIIDYNLEEIKSFVSDDPVNSAVITQDNTKVVSVGGIDAMDVTLTRGKNCFNVNFFDVGNSELVGSYSGHFGTINSVDVHPSCNIYCSGGEEGFVNLVTMGKDYESAPFLKY